MIPIKFNVPKQSPKNIISTRDKVDNKKVAFCIEPDDDDVRYVVKSA